MSDRLKRHVARHAAKMTFGDFAACLPFPANPLYDTANLMTLFPLRGNFGSGQ